MLRCGVSLRAAHARGTIVFSLFFFCSVVCGECLTLLTHFIVSPSHRLMSRALKRARLPVQQARSKADYTQLPQAALHRVLQHLELHEILVLVQTCKELNESITQDDLFWATHFVGSLGRSRYDQLRHAIEGDPRNVACEFSVFQHYVWTMWGLIDGVDFDRQRDIWVALAKQRKRQALQDMQASDD